MHPMHAEVDAPSLAAPSLAAPNLAAHVVEAAIFGGGEIVPSNVVSLLAPRSAIIYGGTTMRVVIDTDVLVSAFISPEGASRQLVLDALDGKFTLLLSTPLLVEYESVLRRPKHLERAQATLAEVDEILDGLAGVCSPVVFDYHWRPTGADADDELVVETAINGQADVLATFNVKHMRDAAARFGFAVRLPGPLVRKLRS